MSSRKPSTRGGAIPPLSFVEALDTNRLIPSLYSFTEDSLIRKIAHGGDLQTGLQLDALTSGAAQFDRIDPGELVKGIPYATIINAAFCHCPKQGTRFSVSGRNAWYAALAVETAQAEVIYHKTIELSEMGEYHLEATFDQYLADFRCELHDLRKLPRKDAILSPTSYTKAQELAAALLSRGSLGVIYPSVRDPRGTCVACFRPALVTNVRKAVTYRFRWSGQDSPVAVTALGRR